MYIKSTDLANRLESLSAKTDSTSFEELKNVSKDLVTLAKDAIESLIEIELTLNAELIPPTEEFYGDEGIK